MLVLCHDYRMRYARWIRVGISAAKCLGHWNNFYLLGPWGTELRFWLRFVVIFLVRAAVDSACALRDQVEPTGNSKMADMTQSRNASLCGDSCFENLKEFEYLWRNVYRKAQKIPSASSSRIHRLQDKVISYIMHFILKQHCIAEAHSVIVSQLGGSTGSEVLPRKN